ncbi:MAG: GAF domain-containing sensor histidine kinase [Candidatus Dormiibacterota bacterium]
MVLVRLARVSAWSLAGLIIVVSVACVGLYLLILSHPFHPYGFPGAVVIFTITAATFGALIVSRQPKNGVGWALLLSSLFLATNETAQAYTIRTIFVAPDSLPLAWLSAWFHAWMWVPGVAIATLFLPLLFPDSSLRGWPVKVLAILSVALTVTATVVLAIFTFPGTGAVQVGADAQLGGAHSIQHLPGFIVAYTLIPVLALATLVRLGVRFQRSTGEQRQQFKWFAYACVIVVVGAAASSLGNIFSPRGQTSAPQGLLGQLAAGILVLSLLAIPIGAGIAILKYRLYDIDVVISRTLVYGSLAAFITAVYVGIVVGVGTLVGSGGQPNLVLSIIATAIVAVAFQPVRERLNKIANRLVYGKRATPYEVLSQFSERVAETYAADEALPRMARVLGEGTGADRAEVWLRRGGSLLPAAAWPVAVDPASAGPDGDNDVRSAEAIELNGQELPQMPGTDRAAAVRHQGELLGALTVTKRRGESLSPVEDKLLTDLASQAGLVLKNVGLTAELLQRLDELRASRQRLVAAQDEERRKLERNLHDGAQQNLVALKVKLGLAEALAEKDPARARELVGQLKSEADEALETLRDLARGIYPPLLADKGLGEALQAQARKATILVSVEADGVGRYPQDVEAAVYFCVLEALQNVQKYAQAAHATLRLAEKNATLIFEVEDDGKGFDATTAIRGSGITNMSDRLDALGGTIVVDSTPGQGARLKGTLPARQLEVVA